LIFFVLCGLVTMVVPNCFPNTRLPEPLKIVTNSQKVSFVLVF